MYSSNQFETSGDIQSIILWGATILENSIHLPCHQYWWGCVVYVYLYIYIEFISCPYLEEKIPYKTRTTRLYFHCFFFETKTWYKMTSPTRWWPDFSWLKGLPMSAGSTINGNLACWQVRQQGTEKDRFRRPIRYIRWMSREVRIKGWDSRGFFYPKEYPI